jgi:hypothetical protein
VERSSSSRRPHESAAEQASATGREEGTENLSSLCPQPYGRPGKLGATPLPYIQVDKLRRCPLTQQFSQWACALPLLLTATLVISWAVEPQLAEQSAVHNYVFSFRDVRSVVSARSIVVSKGNCCHIIPVCETTYPAPQSTIPPLNAFRASGEDLFGRVAVFCRRLRFRVQEGTDRRSMQTGCAPAGSL